MTVFMKILQQIPKDIYFPNFLESALLVSLVVSLVLFVAIKLYEQLKNHSA